MKRRSLFGALAALSALASLIVAPQAALALLKPEVVSPNPWFKFTSLCVYEIGMWGPGLAIWIAGQKLGWLDYFSFRTTFIICIIPCLMELILSLSFGQLSAGFSTAEGISIKLCFFSMSYLLAKRFHTKYAKSSA